MNIGLYQSAASLSALERWQETVTQNITSGEETAYKKHTTAFSGEEKGEFLTDAKSQVGKGEGLMATFPVAHTSISFQPGQTRPTNQELDVALQGEGFFELKMPDGEKAYTRVGEFHLRSDRMVASSQDGLVMLESGQPLQLRPGQGSLVIDESGNITQGGTALGKLAIRSFEKPENLVSLSAGLFIPGEGMEAAPVTKPEVLQGNLESSNSTSLQEMVDLVTISRAYEANQKLISSRDELLDKTLQAFG